MEAIADDARDWIEKLVDARDAVVEAADFWVYEVHSLRSGPDSSRQMAEAHLKLIYAVYAMRRAKIAGREGR